MKELPIGVQDFEQIRRDDMLYVDKTGRLMELINKGRRYFLSRPRRFGKSLTLSTLEAMFKGQAELFRGLKAEQWVEEQAKYPLPVLKFDMSTRETRTTTTFYSSLKTMLNRTSKMFNIGLTSDIVSDMLEELIEELCNRYEQVIVLIDEYDKPILDNLTDFVKVNEIREVLRSFYTTLKSCDKYLRFVMLTGISKFSKMGVFSAMNNLNDISMDERYGDLVGYTQQELEDCFGDILIEIASRLKLSREEILARLKDYYDGFSFDGLTRLYNPFSILQCLEKASFSNYWYESGSPSFIVEWMKEHQIRDPEEYRHITVNSDFISAQEIEHADAPSFLYQSGYLTIESKEEQLLTLDYPNKEVLNSLSSMYLKLVYRVKNYAGLGREIWNALKVADITRIVELYNTALAEIPYDDYAKNRNEFWYRSMFMMLLRGVGIITYAEIHTHKGRSDLLILFKDLIIVLEFKFAKTSSDVERLKAEGTAQLRDREYTKGYELEGRRITSAVLVADDERRKVITS